MNPTQVLDYLRDEINKTDKWHASTNGKKLDVANPRPKWYRILDLWFDGGCGPGIYLGCITINNQTITYHHRQGHKLQLSDPQLLNKIHKLIEQANANRTKY